MFTSKEIERISREAAQEYYKAKRQGYPLKKSGFTSEEIELAGRKALQEFYVRIQ